MGQPSVQVLVRGCTADMAANLQRLVAYAILNESRIIVCAQEVLGPERGLSSFVAYFMPVLRKVAI